MVYKEKKRDYGMTRTKDYISHRNPDNSPQEYVDDDVSVKYKDSLKDELLYKIANRGPREEEEEDKPIEAADTIKIMQREAVPREDISEITRLRCEGPQIIGNLFDRVEFLEERIKELTDATELRKSINEEILKDIDEDVRDKETFITQCVDFDDIRSIKLHISMLKQQKRKELLQFFHDTVELSTELRALKEEHRSEKKITSLFEDIKGI